VSARLLVLGLAFAALACGPMGPISGGKLDGELVSGPVADWSFTEHAETVAVETRPGDPYSVNVWAVAEGPRLYVASGSGPETTWAKNVLSDPRVRVRVDGKLYELQAVRVQDAAEQEAALLLYKRKYDYQPKEEEAGKAVLFRLDPRS
jgi:deazaflavin-dependent oxidoreductase (nitroreductase family)